MVRTKGGRKRIEGYISVNGFIGSDRECEEQHGCNSDGQECIKRKCIHEHRQHDSDVDIGIDIRHRDIGYPISVFS